MDCSVTNSIIKPAADHSSDDCWNASPLVSRTRSSSQDIQETKNAPITTNASKPRSMAWHDRRAALQATPMSTQSLRLPLNHAAQQRAMPYQTSIQTRPTRDRKLEPKAASATLGLRSTQKSYVQHKTYDTAAAAALPPKQRLKMGPPLPPKPAPLPENFEGLKGEEQISLSKRAFRVHCQDCGSELERSSERLGGSIVEYVCPERCDERLRRER